MVVMGMVMVMVRVMVVVDWRVVCARGCRHAPAGHVPLTQVAEGGSAGLVGRWGCASTLCHADALRGRAIGLFAVVSGWWTFPVPVHLQTIILGTFRSKLLLYDLLTLRLTWSNRQDFNLKLLK